MIEEDCVQSGILLSSVTSKFLAKVIEYCNKHAAVEEQGEESDLKKWGSDFMYVDQETLFDLILAANYLNNRGLFELTCGTVADMMRTKTPEQIRETFHIVNDYTPEEEEVKRENSWAFE